MRVAVLLLVAAATACADRSDGANPNPECHPLATSPGGCALPWPSSHFERADPSTVTGHRLAIPRGLLPPGPSGLPMDPARLNQRDGFSPASTLLVHFAQAIDPAQLPSELAPLRSLEVDSPVQLLDAQTGQRVLLFAELDANASDPTDQALLIHPLARLAPNRHYLVALRGLRDRSGAPVRSAPFEALRRGEVTTPNLFAEFDKYLDLFVRLESAGIPRDALSFAWDFHTGSDEQLVANLLKMRDEALPAWGAEKLGYDVALTDATDEQLWFELQGNFEVPTYLTDDSDDGILIVDGEGRPQRRGVQRFPLTIHVPRCAETATQPLPVMVFGHGLFGAAASEMNSGYQRRVIDELCMIQIGTDWIGMSSVDGPAVATEVVPDFTNLPRITDRLQQAQLNFVVLARLGRDLLKRDPRLRVGDRPITDGKQLYYYGISQGGIEGGTLLALSPDLQRGALNVGGGNYSLMVMRSVDFRTFKQLLNLTYPSQRDQQLLVALSQSFWDFSDPISFAERVRRRPLPDLDGAPLPARPLVLQEAIGDSQVPNLATRLLARSYGLPLLQPAVEEVPQLGTIEVPSEAAYVQWDVAPQPLPGLGNTPPDADNGAHGAIRKLPALVEQLRRFFRPDGLVENTCDGACRFPGASE